MIHVVAVSYFGSEDVARLLPSLQSQSSPDWRLTVVDNSVDGTEAERLRLVLDGCERAQLRVAPRNLGYIGGARLALGGEGAMRDAWTVVCNTDVVFEDQALGELLEVRDETIGLVAPRIVSSRTLCDQNPFLTSRPSKTAQRRRRARLATPLLAQLALLGSIVSRQLRPGQRDDLKARRAHAEGATENTPIYAAHGSAFALSRNYFARGGDLNHPLFLFGEELYFAEQCRAIGLQVVHAPRIRVAHHEHANTGIIRRRVVLRAMVAAGRFGVSHLYPES